jgi:PleD family two-component response regulator
VDTKPNPRILIVDDQRSIHTIIRIALGEDRFRFLEATRGEEAWRQVHAERPDLVLCDYEMPGMNGIELVRRLRRHALLCHIPVIMLTSHGSVEAVVAGLDAGADDYIVKPFEPDELVVRIQAQLRRRDRDLLSDALTRLPSGDALRWEFERRIAVGLPFATIYADLDHFKPYVDRFGFLRAGSVIRRTSELLYAAFREAAGEEAFVGHIAGDDFIAISMAEQAEPACRVFVERFAEALPEFYETEDLERGYLNGLDRSGLAQRFPLLAVSLCIVDSREHGLATPEDIVRLAFDARPAAKAVPGCSIVRA